MRISIIICSLNGEEVLPACLTSVLGSTYKDIEVIVVDNGSTDGTARVVKEEFPSVTLLRAPRNLGFAGGNNPGIRAARGDIVVLLNDDTEVEPDWLDAAIDAAQRHPDWGIMGAKLLYPDKTTIQHAGGSIQPNALTQHAGNGEKDEGQYNDDRPCDYVTGAAFFINRELLDSIGLLDDGYFPIYFEEVDYCYRARRAGFNVYYIPAIKIYHYESRTTHKLSRGFLYKYHKNRLRFILKQFTWRELVRAVRAELRWLRHSHDTPLIHSLARAYLTTLLHLPAILHARWKEPQNSDSPKKSL